MKSILKQILFFAFASFINTLLVACSAGPSGNSNSIQTLNKRPANESMHITPLTNGLLNTNAQAVKLNANTQAVNCANSDLTSFGILYNGDYVLGDISGDQIVVRLPGADLTGLKAASFTKCDKNASVYVDGVLQNSRAQPFNVFKSPVIYTVKSADRSMSKNYTVIVNNSTDTSKEIEKFGLLDSNGSLINGVISQEKHLITVNMGAETNLSSLKAVFYDTGKDVLVGELIQKSGETVNDFNHPVVYTVVARNGSSESYTVVVRSSITKEILNYSLSVDGNYIKGAIQGNSIIVIVPYGTYKDYNGVKKAYTTAQFLITGKSLAVNGENIVSKLNRIIFIESTALIHTVCPDVGSCVNYKVIAVSAPSPEHKIDSYSINGVIGKFGANNSITVESLPISSKLSSLKPKFSYTGKSITVNNVPQTSESSILDFAKTNPIKYVVSAEDGSSVTYTVSVSQKKRSGTMLLYTLYNGYLMWDDQMVTYKFDKASKTISQFSNPINIFKGAVVEQSSSSLINDPLGKYIFVRANGVTNLCMKNFIQTLPVDSVSGILSVGLINTHISCSDHPTFGRAVINPYENVDDKDKPNYFYQIYNHSDGNSTIDTYKIDKKTGELSFVDGYVEAQDQKFDMAINPKNGNTMYVTNTNLNTITRYDIDSDTGALKKPADSPTFDSGGENAHNIIITSNGKNLYVDNKNTKNIVTFSIDINGKLKSIQTIPTQGNLPVINMVTNPKYSKYLFVNTGSNITTYIINNKDGTLSLSNNLIVPVTPWAISVDPNGEYLATIDNNSQGICKINIYSIDDDMNGLLSNLGFYYINCQKDPAIILKDFNS